MRTDVSSGAATDLGFTGQRNLDAQGKESLGLMDYHARMYDALIGRFISPDSVIPGGGPQSLNRYSYVLDDPIALNDPTGHNFSCGGGLICHDPVSDSIPISGGGGITYTSGRRGEGGNRHKGSGKSITVILACGEYLDAKCEGDFTDYGNKQPLSDYAQWAKQNSFSFQYFGSNGESLNDYQRDILKYMINNPGQAFLLIGHSLGADAALGAAYAEKSKGINITILGVVLLDAGAGINQSQNHPDIDYLETKHVPVASFTSHAYNNSASPGFNLLQYAKNLYNCSSLTCATIPKNSTLVSKEDAKNHYDMAADQSVFTDYTERTLNSWIQP